jgi:nucleoside-diphosphate-sugar epimerase
MKVLLAGATGAIGLPLTRMLVQRGHEVLGLARNPAGAGSLQALGAVPLVADALDRDSLLRAVRGRTADAIIDELTALKKPPYHHGGMAMTNRLRIDGSANLLKAAQALGAKRFVTQSIVFGYGYYDHGTSLLTEEAPFGMPAGDAFDTHMAAMLAAERQALSLPEGIALRYGLFYGGDAALMQPMLKRRRLPVVSGGLLGWVHHDDAVTATVAALERGRAGRAYNIVDDQPATWREVFTAMADAFDAPRPLVVPRWLLRLGAPYAARVAVGTSMRVGNAAAKNELGWQPRFRSYHDGIRAMAAAAGGLRAA